MNDESVVECATHGQMRAAYVCQHLLQSRRDGHPRGVNWLWDDERLVNAWCDECDAFLDQHGGEWNEKTEAFAGIKLICQSCFDALKETSQTRDLN